MSNYTPGPWYIKTNPIPERNGRLWGWVDANPPGEPDKSISGALVSWTQGEKSEANARLIAAAPELLEALQEVVAFTGAHGGPYVRARAAIAKATGETP